MTTNAEGIVAQLTDEFQGLVAYVTGPDAAEAEAYTVEVTLFRRLLGLGALLLRAFVLTRAMSHASPDDVGSPDLLVIWP